MKVKDLVIGTDMNGTYYVVSKTSGTSKNGDSYITVSLRDNTGIVEGKVWGTVDAVAPFNEKDFVTISGKVNSFKNAPQISIMSLTVENIDPANMGEFVPCTSRDINEMLNRLYNYIDSIRSEYFRQLLNAFFGNEKFIAKFKSNSAAKTVHHATVGGLLEHTICVADICDFMCKQYPKLNRDLLITAAICHDIGKVKEISAFPDNDYTDEGSLLGHIYIGAEMIDVQARKIEGFPRTALSQLKHCILAHHGKLEFGSPKTPAIIEALALSQADDMDAKMRRISDLLDDQSFDTWTNNTDFFLGSKLRRTNI